MRYAHNFEVVYGFDTRSGKNYCHRKYLIIQINLQHITKIKLMSCGKNYCGVNYYQTIVFTILYNIIIMVLIVLILDIALNKLQGRSCRNLSYFTSVILMLSSGPN